jgi:hypothetical protein
MKRVYTLAFLFAFFVLSAYACDIHGITGIVEENNLWIGVEDKEAGGITEADFNDAIDKVYAIYAPIIEKLGKKLVVNRKWEDGTVNAFAQQTGLNWQVSMFGGLARHQAITKDGFTTVICHEIGHHLAGAPKTTSFFGAVTWASNEGQSDYWATSKCLKKYMENDDNVKIVEQLDLPDHLVKSCESTYGSEAEQALCKRIGMAGMSLANLFKDLRKLTVPLNFATPDPKVVTDTNHKHPDPQCRLDTYYQGGLCDLDPNLVTSSTDSKIGHCNQVDGYNIGIRPLCWFKP